MSLWLGKSCVLQGWLFVSCQKRRSPLTTFKHILARTLVAAARGTSIVRWIFNKEGFVSNLKTLPPDAQFPQPQRHYEVARSPRRAHPSPTKTHTNTPKHTPQFSFTQLKTLHIIAVDSQEGFLYCIHTIQVTCVDDNYSSGFVR